MTGARIAFGLLPPTRPIGPSGCAACGTRPHTVPDFSAYTARELIDVAVERICVRERLT